MYVSTLRIQIHVTIVPHHNKFSFWETKKNAWWFHVSFNLSFLFKQLRHKYKIVWNISFINLCGNLYVRGICNFLQNALRQANKLCALQKLWLFYYFIPCLSQNATPTMTLTMIMSNTLNSRNTQIQFDARFCNASLIGLFFPK